MLDKHGMGFLTGPQLQENLAAYGLFAHKQDVYLFVRRFDRDADGRIVYSDLCDAFTPMQAELAHNLNHRDAFHSKQGFCK